MAKMSTDNQKKDRKGLTEDIIVDQWQKVWLNIKKLAKKKKRSTKNSEVNWGQKKLIGCFESTPTDEKYKLRLAP